MTPTRITTNEKNFILALRKHGDFDTFKLTLKNPATLIATFHLCPAATEPLLLESTEAVPTGAKIHARTEWCPACNVRLIKINLSETHARKGCTSCKRKFDYVRSDTPEGRAMRTRVSRGNGSVDFIKSTQKLPNFNATGVKLPDLSQINVAAVKTGEEIS